MIPLIANVLQPLIDVSEAILKFWHGVVGSWGLAIIFMTFTIRLAILPLTFRSVKGMQELQRLQPEMKRIQERFKEDRQRMNQEMMKMYQEHGVNPLSSCLPLLLQLPFFIALFYLLRGGEFKQDIRGAESFLFIPDLAQKLTEEPGVLALMIVLYVGTQLAATSITAFSADPTQRRIMFALPFIFVPFIINFPAGLLVYWITTNVWTIGQQLLVKKLFPKPEPFGPKEDEGEAPARGKPRAPKPAASSAAAAVGKAEAKQRPSKDGKAAKAGPKAGAKRGAAKAATAEEAGNGASAAKPPPGPRKKKKRSGRRR